MIERQIGRLLGETRARRPVLERSARGRHHARGCASTGRAAADWEEWAHHSEGCYVLRTNVADWTAEDLWRTYIQLTEAEAAFRIQKSDLSIRPVWHQKPERVHAHIFVCFLAYVLWKTLEQWQKRAGLGNSPRTILEELGAIPAPMSSCPSPNRPRELRLRCVVRPDKPQAVAPRSPRPTATERLRALAAPGM